MANWLSRIAQLLTKTAEGQYRPGPYYLPVSGGWLSADVGSTTNWWQRGYNLQSACSPTAMVEACISAYAQTTAMCPGYHWVTDDDHGRTRQINSALSRILKKPNGYQTISDFMLNLVRNLYAYGNSYAVALRNSRYEVTELHLMNPASCSPVFIDGEVFYSLHGNVVVDYMKDFPTEQGFIPQRDVLHLKLNATPYNPLKGMSPILAALNDIAANNAMLQQQLNFYLNQARPSAVLATDLNLNKEQVDALRERWNDQVKGLAAGGTPILTAGLKPVTLSQNPVDSQLAEMMKLSEQHIALAFRIPMQILGIGAGTPMSSTEALMNSWLASSLGFCLNHIEEGFGKLFVLKGYPDEYMELDTAALLRSNFKERIDALTRGVQGGIISPNEARASENYKAVKYGDEPRVQQQVVPLSAASQIQQQGPGSGPPIHAAPGPGAPPPAAAQKDAADVTRLSANITRHERQHLRARVNRIRHS